MTEFPDSLTTTHIRSQLYRRRHTTRESLFETLMSSQQKYRFQRSFPLTIEGLTSNLHIFEILPPDMDQGKLLIYSIQYPNRTIIADHIVVDTRKWTLRATIEGKPSSKTFVFSIDPRIQEEDSTLIEWKWLR